MQTKHAGQLLRLWRRRLGLTRRQPAPEAPAAVRVGRTVPPPEVWLREAPFTLALSAGFFGFFTHTGLICALEECGLRPRRIVGTSAGAITGGMWAAGYDAADLVRINAGVRREDFWDPGLVVPGWLPGRRLQALLVRLFAAVGVRRLQDCPTPFAAVTFDVLRCRTRVLERGPAASAVRASAALPGLFRPVRWGGALLCDGGVLDRGAHRGLAHGERALLHHIGSQDWLHRLTNPGVLADSATRRTLYATPGPRIDPGRLADGTRAFELAYARARAWLRGEPTGEAPSHG